MTLVYNKAGFKDKRRALRRNRTESERVIWKRLRNKGCSGFKFFRQYSAGPYILDFYCPERKLAIELDGGQHTEEETKEYDRARNDFLKTMGIEVVRFWNNEVHRNIEGVMESIQRRLTPPPPAPPL